MLLACFVCVCEKEGRGKRRRRREKGTPVSEKGMQGRKKGMGGGRMKGCRTQGDTNIEEGDEKRHWVVVKGGRTVYFFDIPQSPCTC